MNHLELLRHLARESVVEIALASGRLPCVKEGPSFQPIADATISSDEIMEILFAAGGSRYVDDLGAAPVTWNYRFEGVGLVKVGAIQRPDGSIQARFTVAKRDAGAAVVITAPERHRREPAAPREPGDARAPVRWTSDRRRRSSESLSPRAVRPRRCVRARR